MFASSSGMKVRGEEEKSAVQLGEAGVHVIHCLCKPCASGGGHFVGKIVNGVGNATIQAIQCDPRHVLNPIPVHVLSGLEAAGHGGSVWFSGRCGNSSRQAR